MARNNSDYWNDRKQQFSASLAKDEKRLFSKLAAYYEREAAALEKQIAAYYTQYGEGNVLAYRQLLQTLDAAEVQLLMQDCNAFAEKYPEYADFLPVRESIYKLNRLEGLQTSILLQQLEIGAVEQEQLTAFFLKQAARYANFSAEWLGFGEQFYRIDSDMVKKAVGNSWCEGKNFSERIWDNRQKLAHTLQTEVVNGIIRGEDYHTLARNLRQKFTNVSRKQAERLVYTEDTYLSCEAAITPFEKDPNFTQYRFACTMDGSECDICRALSGQTFSIKERTPGTNFPPMHPWCRCFFDIVVPDLETMRRNEKKSAENRSNSDAILLTDRQDSGIIKTDERFEINPDKIKKFLLKPGAKHSKEFFDVGYTPDDYELLFDDIASNFNMDAAFARIEKPDGSIDFCIYMDLGITKKKNFKVVWKKDNPESKPRLITAHREGKKHV